MEIVIVIVILVAAAIGYFVWRSRQEPELPAAQPRELERARPAREPARDKEARAPAKKESKRPPPRDEDEAPIDEESARPISVQPEAPRPPPAPIAPHKKDVESLRKGLAKVRQEGGLFGRLRALFQGKKEIDPSIVEEMEEILLTSDVGVKTTQELLDDIREGLDRQELADSEAVWTALRRRAIALLELKGGGAVRNHGVPTVVLMVGVNGTGKTTTIGKLATKFVEQGKKVLLVAGDTFRAAAVAQLEAWGERVSCDVFSSKEGADPAAVVFDAIKHGNDSGHDIILVDTAGRLHTKANLMDELKKVARTADKALPGAPHETLLVVDGTNGQNAVQQAQEFSAALELSGIVLTKLDGTAKGGVVLAIASEHHLPVRYIGVGERPADLRDFDAEEFVEAMLGASDSAAQAA
ncbi:MAG TPA: signal recognition particle-docking protein FtsY [Polyangiaceae bacterium]|nr:signal recognition particle-docking protein FtsY [Polyangiaceae bacterium]